MTFTPEQAEERAASATDYPVQGSSPTIRGKRPPTSRDDGATRNGRAGRGDTAGQRGRTTSGDQESGTEVSVAFVSTPGDGSCGIGTYTRDLSEAYDGGDTETIPIAQDSRTVGHFLALAWRAVTSDADVVHVQHEYGLFRREGSRYPGIMGLVFFPALLLGNLLADKEIVVTMHSVLKPSPADAPLRVRLYLQIMHQLIAVASDHLVFLAADCERRFHEDVRADRPPYSVLAHGVNAGKASDVPRTVAKERLGIAADAQVVVIPGFLRPPKGHDIFVSVARHLPDVQFLIAGGARPKGEDFEFAREIAAEAPDNVTITGVLDDAAFPATLAAADLALLPYRVVSQSGTFNWCAAQELPILASDEPYFQRIANDWDALEITPLDDPAAIAHRVESLLDDPDRRATLSEHVRQYKTLNSFDRVASDHWQLYRSLRGDYDAVVATTADATAHADRTQSLRAACSAQRGGVIHSDD